MTTGSVNVGYAFCPDGYYFGTNECHSCPTHCKTCTASDVCTACDDGIELISNGCHLISEATNAAT